MVRGEVLSEVLKKSAMVVGLGVRELYRFVPVDRYTSAVDVGGCSVFQILETSIARFLAWSV